jgi:hypothetical protein
MFHIVFGFTVDELKGFKDFNLALGMLIATTNATKDAQIYLKTISLKNFDIPPNIEILIFKKNKIHM